MLVLSRKPGEKVVIGNGITVTVLEVTGNRVRVGLDAPDDLRILRAELACWQDEPAAGASQPDLRSCAEGKMSDRPGEEIVRLVTASSLQEAHLWRQALEEQGIRCQVVGEYLGGFGIVPPGHPVPELWVRREDAERAQAILEGLRQPRPR